MKRFQSRRGNGRFTRNTTENCFGFHTSVCAECRRFNTWNVGAPKPTHCHACGVELRDIDEPANPIAEFAQAINDAPKVAEAPFALTSEIDRRKGKQGGLF